MASRHTITVNGTTFVARTGELLLDAALKNGVDLPYDCRAGHCGTCCVRIVSGEVRGGEGAEPGVVHACQCRIAGDAILERGEAPGVRTVAGVLTSLRALSPEVVEAGITTDRAFPYLAGQYVKVRFDGFPSRPYSITHPLRGASNARTTWFHIRRAADGRVTSALGARIAPGHRVTLAGPYGSAHFRANTQGRLVLVATNTGFAPIWSIAVAALRENPQRSVLIIAGGRTLQSLYMGPALAQLSRFPNTIVVPVCSRAKDLPPMVMPGRPTDYMPVLLPTDTVYACGAEGMVESVKAIAARSGATCYADPFLPASDETVEDGLLTRAMGWLSVPTAPRLRQRPVAVARDSREPQFQTLGLAEARLTRRFGS